MIDRPLVHGRNVGTIVCPTGSVSAIVAEAWLSIRCDGGGRAQVWFQRSADSDGPPPGAGAPWLAADGSGLPFKHATRLCGGVPDGTEYLMYVIDANGDGAICVELRAR